MLPVRLRMEYGKASTWIWNKKNCFFDKLTLSYWLNENHFPHDSSEPTGVNRKKSKMTGVYGRATKESSTKY